MTESPLDGTDLEGFRAGNDDDAVEAALAAARSYCGWHIAPVRVDTLRLKAVGGTIILPTLRANAVTISSGGTTLTADDYILEPGFVRLSGRWWGTGIVDVVLTHGYETLPADVREAILSAAHSGSYAVNGRLKSAGPFTYEFPDGSREARTLDRYRLAARP